MRNLQKQNNKQFNTKTYKTILVDQRPEFIKKLAKDYPFLVNKQLNQKIRKLGGLYLAGIILYNGYNSMFGNTDINQQTNQSSADPLYQKMLLSWGSGINGQLGTGTEAFSVGTPTQITVLGDEEITQVNASSDISAVVTIKGQIYTWGKTKGGSMNQKENLSRQTNLVLPTMVDAPNVNFKQVACGKTHLAGVTQDGQLITWGDPDQGKLGHNASLQKESKNKTYGPRSYKDYNAIDYVHGDLDGKKVRQAACGFQHTACVTEDGEVYTWGFGKNGALGHGNWDQIDVPKKVEGLKDIIKVECGNDYTIALDKNGNLYSWGSNRYGQLGTTQANLQKYNVPTMIHLPHGSSHVIDFSCGEEHSAFLNDKGEAYTWGYGNDGQLGHQEKANLNQPKRLQFEGKISRVVCGGGHTGIVTEGKLFLFGRGRDGQLGRGDSMESQAAYRTEPKEVNYIRETLKAEVQDLALGNNHCIALAARKL